MAEVLTSFKLQYVAGETVAFRISAQGAQNVSVIVDKTTYICNLADGVWSAIVPTANLIGRVHWSAMASSADGSVECIGRGSLNVVCAGRSPLRDVIDKIDEAIATWGTNPNRSISVGEISISYKSLDDLIAVRSQYVQRAEEQESGRATTGGVRVMEVRF